jgi:Arc/MetJ-type ribon-helix-helix transcriptional regulator
MPEPATRTMRRLVTMPLELAAEIDAYRREGRFTTEAEAIRDLLRAGLEARRKRPA